MLSSSLRREETSFVELFSSCFKMIQVSNGEVCIVPVRKSSSRRSTRDEIASKNVWRGTVRGSCKLRMAVRLNS